MFLTIVKISVSQYSYSSYAYTIICRSLVRYIASAWKIIKYKYFNLKIAI